MASPRITKTPGVCGGDACIADTRIPVWVLVNARNQGSTNMELLRDYPSLTADDLGVAWAYAVTNEQEIAAAMFADEIQSDLTPGGNLRWPN